MDKMKASITGSVAALWLTLSGCAFNGVEQENQAEMNVCNTTLVDDLAINDTYERLLSGGNYTYNLFQDKDIETEGKNLSEQIQSFKKIRTKELETLFGCRDDNKVLHGYANRIHQNPSDHATFKKLMVTLASTHMDDVKALYPVERFFAVTDEWTSQFFENSSMILKQMNVPFDEGDLAEKLQGAIEKNYENLAILAMEVELADTFNIGMRAEQNLQMLLQKNMVNLIVKEVSGYMTELQEQKASGVEYLSI
ncbi:MAG: hypothetical protein COA45_01450 [Zetaproteobacteria bacterium]|nr:MAG: hypothetical protein COA45_01450 [Zetaproteobacteria bacterium]